MSERIPSSLDACFDQVLAETDSCVTAAATDGGASELPAQPDRRKEPLAGIRAVRTRGRRPAARRPGPAKARGKSAQRRGRRAAAGRGRRTAGRGKPQAARRSRGTPRARAGAPLLRAAHAAGRAAGAGLAGRPEAASPHAQSAAWAAWLRALRRRLAPAVHAAAVQRFLAGFTAAAGLPPAPADRLLLPTARRVGVIVTAMNEEATVPALIAQLNRLPFHELLFIVNGSTDKTFAQIRRLASGAMVLHYTRALGHDVGRAVGGRMLTSDIILFLDADIPLEAEQLLPFIEAVDRGADVALNDISPWLGPFASRDPVSIMKEFANRSMGRSELRANSMTAVPHALSREAMNRIGPKMLAVPPKAQALALAAGLRVEIAASVDVIKRNRVRATNSGNRNLVSEMIVGDHLEALREVIRRQGGRLSFPDQIRNRGAIRS